MGTCFLGLLSGGWVLVSKVGLSYFGFDFMGICTGFKLWLLELVLKAYQY